MLAICALAATPLGKRFYEKLGTRLGQRALTVVDCGGLACVLLAVLIFTGSAARSDRVVNVCSWGEYIDEDLITQFEEETGFWHYEWDWEVFA